MNFHLGFSVVFSLMLRLATSELITFNKTCDSYNITERVDLNELTGKWYELSAYGQQENCSFDELKNVTSTNFTVTHHNTTSSYTYNLTEVSNEKILADSINATHTIKIFKIDSYAVFWLCIDNDSTSNQTLIVASRNNSFSEKDEEKIRNKLTDLNLNTTKLLTVKQSKEICYKEITPSSSNKITVTMPLLLLITSLLAVPHTIRSSL